MAKRLSEQEKKNIVIFFTQGKTVDELANDFFCTKETIIRNLRKECGNEKYKELSKNIKVNQNKEKINSFEKKKSPEMKNDDKDYINEFSEEFPSLNSFTEITPLDLEIDNAVQKDLTSVPLSQIDLPNVVFMVVNKSIELETKFLKEYPDWQFLSREELNRKTIEIFLDLKTAKRFCNKEQKVIKVPNTDVFRIVSPILLKKGISRIVSADKLISL